MNSCCCVLQMLIILLTDLGTNLIKDLTTSCRNAGFADVIC